MGPHRAGESTGEVTAARLGRHVGDGAPAGRPPVDRRRTLRRERERVCVEKRWGDYVVQGRGGATKGELHVDWRERIIIDPSILVGKPIVRGTRISVEFVIDLLARGWSDDEILLEYDHLRPEDIRACLLYARDILAQERVYPAPASGA